MGKSSGGGGGQNTVTQQSGPPSQFLNAYQNVTNAAQGVASTPLSQYSGSMVAGFTPQQSQAFDITQNLQGQYTPYLNAAAQSFGQATQPLWPSLPQFNTSGLPQGAATAINNAQQYGAAAAQPIAQQLYPYTETAMGAAQNLTSNAYPYAAIATQPIETQPYTGFGLGQARGLGAQIAPSTGLAMGQAQSVPGAAGSYAGGATNAAGSAPGLIGTYESPYTRQVTSALQNLFNQQNAQQLQQVRGSSVGAGAYGGDREAVAEALTAQQQQLAEAPALSQALQQGYQSSVQAAQQQAALQAQTGLGAGQLTTQAGLGAGQLGLGTAGALTQAGLGAGQLGLGAGQLGLQGQLGQGQLGLGAGNLINQAGAQQGQLALGAGGLLSQGLTSQGQLGLGAGQLNLAAGQGLFNEFNTQQQQQLAAEQANAWLNSQAGFGLSALGQESQNLGLAGAQALLGTGGMQQQIAQEQLNIPYEMFQQQQAYPYQATGWLANIAEGLGSSAGGTSSTSYPGASLGSQLGGLGIAGIGAAGLANQAGLFGEGGIGGLFGGGGAPTAAFDAAQAAGQATTADFGVGSGIWGEKHGGRVPLASGGLAAGGIPGFNMPSPTTPFQIPAGVPDASISVVPDSGGAAGMSPVVSSFLKPSTTTTQTGGGSGGGGGNAVGDAIGAASIAAKFLPLLLRDGGRIGHDGGGLASGTPGSGFVMPPDAPLTSQPNGLHLPPPPKIGLDSIVPPGPAVKTGSGPPKPPQGGPTAPGSQDLTPQQELQGLGQAVKLFNKPESEARGGLVGIPHPHLGGGLADMSHLAKPAMGLGQQHEGFDVGGGVSPLTAAAPLSNTSPNTQTFYQQLTQMPIEQLREMSVRIPPTTQQGQMIQRALEAKEMTPGAGTTTPTAPTAGGLATAAQQSGLGLAALPGQQQPVMGLSGVGNGAGGIGGYADGGAIPEDPDADPHPIVDHSGKTVVIHYPSEGKSLDLGIPSSPTRRALQGGGNATQGPMQYTPSGKLIGGQENASPQYTAQGAQALAQFYAQNPAASASDIQGTNLAGDAGVLAGNLRAPDPTGPSAPATTGSFTPPATGPAAPAATGQSSLTQTPGQIAQQNILNNALAPPPAQNPGFNIPRPQAINPYANIQVPSAVNVGEATTPRPMNYLPLQTPQLNPASFLGTTNPSYYNNTAPGLPQLPIPGGVNTGIGLPQFPVISGGSGMPNLFPASFSGAHGGRARLQDGGPADAAQEISNETKEILAEHAREPVEGGAGLSGLAGPPSPRASTIVVPSGDAGLTHPDLETTRAAPGMGLAASTPTAPPQVRAGLEATSPPTGMGSPPAPTGGIGSSPKPTTDPELALVARDESGDRNIPNYRYDAGHTAGGHFQITDTNWQHYAPLVGIDVHKYPNAMSAPEEMQGQVAGKMKAETGLMPWVPYNPQLRKDLGISDAGGAAGSGAKTGLVGRQDTGDPIINTGYMAPSQNGLAGNVSDSGLARTTGSRTQYEPGLGASPWLALVAAGLGTMAGRSPQGLVNLGQGGLEGVKVLGKQEEEKMRQAQIANEAENRQATLGIEQQRLTQAGEFHQSELANRAQELGLKQSEMLQKSKQFAQTMGLDYDKLDEQKKRDVIDATWKDEIARIRGLTQEKGNWVYGPGPDPNDPSKKVPGSWFYPVYGDTPRFEPGKGAPKPLAGGGQQTIYQHLIDSGEASSEADAIKKVALWRSDPSAFKNSATFAGLVVKEATGLRGTMAGMTMPQDQLTALAEKNVLDAFGKSPGAAPTAAPSQTAPATPAAAPATPEITRPAAVPKGSAYSPSRQQWRSPDGKLFDAQGNPTP